MSATKVCIVWGYDTGNEVQNRRQHCAENAQVSRIKKDDERC